VRVVVVVVVVVRVVVVDVGGGFPKNRSVKIIISQKEAQGNFILFSVFFLKFPPYKLFASEILNKSYWL